MSLVEELYFNEMEKNTNKHLFALDKVFVCWVQELKLLLWLLLPLGLQVYPRWCKALLPVETKMTEVQATVEFSVELHKFYNVDLFQRGWVVAFN